MDRFSNRAICVATFFVLAAAGSLWRTSAVACAQATSPAAAIASAEIDGDVVDREGGLGIGGAKVALSRGGGEPLTTAETARDGRFAFKSLAPGIYRIEITARGYAPARSSDLVVASAGSVVTTTLAIERDAGSGGESLKTIGRVSAAAGQNALQSTTTITRSLDPSALQKSGFNRAGEGLGLLPGVNLRGQNGNTGDDLYVDIRGLKPSETQTLLDGHPIGPIGVNSSTTSGGYDYMASPLVGLRDVQVTYGAGALGLYGTDSAGGTVDWQTLEPTRTPTATASQAFGSLGHLSSTIVGSGTFGHIGVVLAHGVLGDNGLFSPGQQLQRGLLGTNLTTANIAKYTYNVGGESTVRSDLAKLRFDLGPLTRLTLTGFAINAWEDKTGTGNNYTPFATQYFATVSKGLATSGPCKGLVAVTTDKGPACLTATQFSAATSGPAGTGAGRTTATRDQDYHARLTSHVLSGDVTLDAFENTYRYDNPTPVSQTTVVPTFANDLYRTFGFLASDDFTTSQNQVGVGYYIQHQRYDGVRNNYFTPTTSSPTPVSSLATINLFLRDVYSPTRAVKLFVNAWLKNSSSSEVNFRSLDPRASLVLRPTSSDVIRLTAGKSVGLPDPVQAVGTGFSNAGSLNPQCNNLTPGVGGINVGTPGVTGLQPETSADYEVAVGHRFNASTTVEGDYYNSDVRNLLFPTTINATLFPAGTIPPAILGNATSGLFNRIYNYSAACKALLNPANPSSLIPYLALTVPSNAANGLFRGFDATIRRRFTPALSFAATWSVQSSVDLDIPTSLLKQNVFLINGAQLFGIPLQKQTAAFDYADGRVFTAHVDATRFGASNQFDSQPFIVTNAYVSKRFRYGSSVSLGVTNLLDARDATYAYTGLGLYVPENAFGKDTTPLTQSATYNKLRSYQPQQFVLTLSQTL